MVDWTKWRQLKKGEVVKEGDFFDSAPNGYKDEPRWIPVEEGDPSQVGEVAPDPLYPAHRRFIRRINVERTGTPERHRKVLAKVRERYAIADARHGVVCDQLESAERTGSPGGEAGSGASPNA